MERLFSVPVKADVMYLRTDAAGGMSSDTYFGAFPCAPYAQHTTVARLRACVRLTGRGRVALRHLSGDGAATDVLVAEQAYDADAPATLALTADLGGYPTGCLYLAVSADAQTHIEDLWYEGEGEVKPARVAVIICTYGGRRTSGAIWRCWPRPWRRTRCWPTAWRSSAWTTAGRSRPRRRPSG